MLKIALVLSTVTVLAGCSSTMAGSERTRQNLAGDMPTVKVPLMSVGLQGRPNSWKSFMVENASNSPMKW